MIEKYQLWQNVSQILIVVLLFASGVAGYISHHLGVKISNLKDENSAQRSAKDHKEILDAIDSHVYTKSPEYSVILQAIEDLKNLIRDCQDPAKKLIYGQRLAFKLKEKADFERNIQTAAEFLNQIDDTSERGAKARSLFSQGRFIDADSVLNENSMKIEFQKLIGQDDKTKKILEQIESAKYNLSNDYILKARLLTTEVTSPATIARSIELYKIATQLSRNTESVFAYALFLRDHNLPGALKELQDALALDNLQPSASTDNELTRKIEIRNTLGTSYADVLDFKNATSAFISGLDIILDYSKSHPSVNKELAVSTLNTNLANLNAKKENFIEARKYFLSSIATLRKNILQKDDTIKINLASGLMNAAVSRAFDAATSNKFLEEAINLYKSILKTNPTIRPQLAKALTNYGVLAKDAGLKPLARSYYQQALEIREKLYEENSFSYGEDYAYSLNNLGSNLRLENRAESLKYLQKALIIRKQLYDLDHKRYAQQVSETLYNLSFYRYDDNDLEQAINLMQETIQYLDEVRAGVPEYERQYEESLEDLANFKAALKTRIK